MSDFVCLSSEACEKSNEKIIRFWRHVILYTLQDALNDLNFKLKREAIAWFVKGRDFNLFCELANCQAKKTRFFILKIIAYHDKRVLPLVFKWAKR